MPNKAKLQHQRCEIGQPVTTLGVSSAQNIPHQSRLRPQNPQWKNCTLPYLRRSTLAAGSAKSRKSGNKKDGTWRWHLAAKPKKNKHESTLIGTNALKLKSGKTDYDEAFN
jgi:hypothetical protein